MEEQLNIPFDEEDKEEYLKNLNELDELDDWDIEFINRELDNL